MGNFFASLFGSKEETKKEEDSKKPDADEENDEKHKEDDGHVEKTEEPAKRSFAAELMEEQNKYRKKHGAEPLKLNEDMCKEAQRWAEHLAKIQTLEHSETNDGENLSFASPELSGKKAADMWYSEIEDYDFDNPGFRGNTGHFTQVVWKGSKEFGAGIAQGPNGLYAVGRYSPAGNITNAGQFESNVLPAR